MISQTQALGLVIFGMLSLVFYFWKAWDEEKIDNFELNVCNINLRAENETLRQHLIDIGEENSKLKKTVELLKGE